MNLQKLALILALLFSGPAVWSLSWSFFYPSFQIMYWQQWGDWTPTTFQNYLTLGISGIYIIGFLLIAWKGEKGLALGKLQTVSQTPENKVLDSSSLSRRSESPAPNPQLSEIMESLQSMSKRMEGIEQSQAKIKPFLKLAPEGEK